MFENSFPPSARPNSSIPNKTITPSCILLYKTFSQNKSQSSIFPSILCVCTTVWFPNPSLFMEPLRPPWYPPIHPPFSHALHIRYNPPYFQNFILCIKMDIRLMSLNAETTDTPAIPMISNHPVPIQIISSNTLLKSCILFIYLWSNLHRERQEHNTFLTKR